MFWLDHLYIVVNGALWVAKVYFMILMVTGLVTMVIFEINLEEIEHK